MIESIGQIQRLVHGFNGHAMQVAEKFKAVDRALGVFTNRAQRRAAGGR